MSLNIMKPSCAPLLTNGLPMIPRGNIFWEMSLPQTNKQTNKLPSPY